jgi:hypothetical protein
MNGKTTSLYKIEPKTETALFGINFDYPKITPAGDSGFGGNIDILNKFRWKTNDGLTDEVPYVILMEYELPYGMWTSRLTNILDSVKSALYSGDSDPYIKLYTGTATGFSYVLPYLLKNGDSVRGSGVKNAWKEVDITQSVGKVPLVGRDLAGIGKSISDTLQVVGETFSPGYGTEKIMNYSSTERKSITITFPLYNTVDEGEAINNFDFVNLFALQNLKTRTSWLTFVPPKLYVVEGVGLGGIYMPACYVSNYDFKAIGTTRYVKAYGNSGKDYLIPEAYKVSITLTELVPESSNIMWGALGGPKVQIINSPASVEQTRATISVRENNIIQPGNLVA